MKIQLSINELEQIIALAKHAKSLDSSLSSTIELNILSQTDTHNGSDSFIAGIKSGFAECNSTHLLTSCKKDELTRLTDY